MSWEQEDARSRRAEASDREFYLAYKDLHHNEGPPIVNAGLAGLQVLIGEWKLDISSLDSGKAEGTVVCEWVQEQAFLTMRTHIPYGWEGLTTSRTIISHSSHDTDHTAHYANDCGEFCDYFMTLANGSWMMGNKTPGVWQRFFGEIQDNGNYISGKWEHSPDGTTWEQQCHLAYWRNT